VQAGVAEADAVILRMPLHSLADNDADAQVISFPPVCVICVQLFPLLRLYGIKWNTGGNTLHSQCLVRSADILTSRHHVILTCLFDLINPSPQ